MQIAVILLAEASKRLVLFAVRTSMPGGIQQPPASSNTPLPRACKYADEWPGEKMRIENLLRFLSCDLFLCCLSV